ncbi:MAP/microtubule affinity-regulating kinase 3 [Bicyclus anynana]|uniref:MAP/microtubule affinity-regulating kinase 3 n=1 Tax=Bicyclus anynana TaxID=110368 RepID=A0ABM3LX16_BICAN|nr:MAP/microtubule affinity-regulating kinase 3 [Bicyclus anynana]XP_052743624.1 MAP/microtubule affinity-regulating kinase 3 [Bicyclus anynana]
MGSIARNKGQVYSVGNYLMTGKLLGKGHFARVEEATHRLIGKKVAIKVIDLTCIKEEYARRNLHREPRVMAKLRHPCIAALYETMMHGPRLYVVMEAAGGGDLCALVLRTRGLPEARARVLAAQLVSAVRHMHCRGVVHRDLKMENIMLDSTRQFIKIVDFGLSNVWSAGGALRTPCGSLEYAAPELFVDGRRYGPEVDLWSIGVIVFGMVTGGLPFAGGAGGGGAGGANGARGAGGAGEGSSRPQLRAAIARGFSGKQRLALACFSAECKTFVQHLLEPNVEARMGIEEAARHRWLRRPGLRLKSQPLPDLDAKANREIYREVSERCGRSPAEVAAHVRAEPFGALGGMYNIRCHCAQLQAAGAEPLWAGARDPSPPCCASADSGRANTPVSSRQSYTPVRLRQNEMSSEAIKPTLPKMIVPHKIDTLSIYQGYIAPHKTESKTVLSDKTRSPIIQSRPLCLHGLSKPVFKVYDNGDCVDPRLPSIDEHSNSPDQDKRRSKLVRRASLDEPLGCLARGEDRPDCYRRAGNGLPSWRGASSTPSARILLQSNATTIKRASLGNIASPHSSSNSHCKSDRTMPIGWYTTRTMHREAHLQRMRRTASLTTK